MKILLFLTCLLCFLNSFAEAQACGYGRGQITVFDEKKLPIKKFKVTFYDLNGFDYSDKPKVVRNQQVRNGWDVYIKDEEAEAFIKGKKAFEYNWFSDPEIVYYKDNTYNYRTIENGGAPVITQVSARGYKSFYFISPVFSDCGYFNQITLMKKSVKNLK